MLIWVKWTSRIWPIQKWCQSQIHQWAIIHEIFYVVWVLVGIFKMTLLWQQHVVQTVRAQDVHFTWTLNNALRKTNGTFSERNPMSQNRKWDLRYWRRWAKTLRSTTCRRGLPSCRLGSSHNTPSPSWDQTSGPEHSPLPPTSEWLLYKNLYHCPW